MPIGSCGPLLCQPFLNTLVFLHQTVAFGDLGVAIILMTVLIRLVLLPLFQKSFRHQAITQKLQPELKKIQEKYKKDPQKKLEATFALHREHGTNPFASFGLMALTLVILFPLYRAFSHITDPTPYLYAFMPHPDELSASFLGLLNLAAPSRIVVVLVALATYFQTKLSLASLPQGDATTPAEKMGKRMAFVSPLIIVVFFWSLPAALNLYILTSTLFSIGQQFYVNRRYLSPKGDATT